MVLILYKQAALNCFGNFTRFINQVKKRKILEKAYTQRGNFFWHQNKKAESPAKIGMGQSQ